MSDKYGQVSKETKHRSPKDHPISSLQLTILQFINSLYADTNRRLEQDCGCERIKMFMWNIEIAEMYKNTNLDVQIVQFGLSANAAKNC